MNQTEHSTDAPEILDVQTGNGETPDFLDLADSLQKAKELIDCIYLAGHGLGDRMKMNAIVRVASEAADVIERVRDHLENYCAGGNHADSNGGTNDDRVIVNVGHLLSEMIEAYEVVHAKINGTEGIADEVDVDRMLAIALSIIGYRPFTKGDESRKAEFLREYTDGTMLTEKEQNALIASMLPEGGAA